MLKIIKTYLMVPCMSLCIYNLSVVSMPLAFCLIKINYLGVFFQLLNVIIFICL